MWALVGGAWPPTRLPSPSPSGACPGGASKQPRSGAGRNGLLVHRYDGYGHDQACRYENTEPTKDQDVGRRAPALAPPVGAHSHCAVIRTRNLLSR